MLDDSDHRHLGQRLDLFHFQEEAPGMVFWHPRGLILYRVLEDAVRRHMDQEGYLEVRTPQLLRQAIWKTSGHWENFANNMFIIEDEGRPAAMKPVSCPGHIQIVERMAPSYRDLPLRISELGLVHRNEPSGTLHGLFRLRQFTQDDGHIFCSEDQIEGEVDRFCRSLRDFYASFGFTDISVGFATRPSPRAGSDEVWDRAEAALSAAAARSGLDCEVNPGQGAFYGPKLEFVLRDRVGRAWQCGTIQLDFVLPERFELRYRDASGWMRAPVMLHRALCGSAERFLGILLEHYRGLLPPWLAPAQAIIAPVGGAQRAYADEVSARLCRLGVRASVDARAETLAKKILDAHGAGVPFVVVVGARETAEQTASIRGRDGEQRALPLAEAVEEIHRLCKPS